ncbi:MAG: hypothetical protein QOI10_2619 [Solirubrobacterales bacterium]|nr:hypothetical protein [Solirubrobacterales bacterium]
MTARKRFDVTFYSPWIGGLLRPGSASASGGAETQILALARGLVRRGHSVCMVVRDTEDGLPASFDGIEIRAIASPKGRGVWKLWWGLHVATALARSRSSAMVQSAAGVETLIVGAISRLYGRRFVYRSANVVDFDFGRLDRNRLRVAAYHLGIRLAQVLVVQTSEQVSLARQRFRRQPVLIKSVAETAAGPPGKSREAFLWIGRLAAYKRPDELLALAAALPRMPFRVVAVPGELDEASLRAEAGRLPNVEWLGPRARTELLELIGSAVAVVNTAEYEGMPNIFLEGWARGVPALSLHHDPDGVIESEGIGLFAAGDRERLAAQAASLWSEEEGARASLARRCVDYVEREHGLDRALDGWEMALGLPSRSRL